MTELQGPGLLEVLAQLAVALVGFSALDYRFSVAASIALLGLQVANAAALFPANEFGVYLLGPISWNSNVPRS